MIKTVSSIFWFLFAVTFLGCAASVKNNVYKISPEAYAWLQHKEIIDVQETYLKDSVLYIKYRIFSDEGQFYHDFYVKANWDEVPARSAALTGYSNMKGSRSADMESVSEVEWQAQAPGTQTVKAMPGQFWENLRTNLIHEMTPQESHQAASFRIGTEEIVVYYDENDQLQMVDLHEMPKSVEIKTTFTQQELAEKIIEGLKKELTVFDKYINKYLITFIEQDSDIPFLYVDVENDFIINIYAEHPGRSKYKRNVIDNGIKSADHLLIDSHILGTVLRPVSSTYRLFTWGRDTVYGFIKPEAIMLLESRPIPPLFEGKGMDLQAFEKRLDMMTGREQTHGSVEFLIGGDEYFPKLIEALLSATKKIYLRTFIFDNDDYGIKIADLLKKKADEDDVKIKVLLDGMGQIMGEGAVPKSLPAGFVPPGPVAVYLTRDSGVSVRQRPNAWFKADHVKTTIIDDEILFTGGMNIGREYRYDWHDLMMFIHGPVVKETRREFDTAWAHAGFWGDLGYLSSKLKAKISRSDKDGYPPIRLLYTNAGDAQIYRAQLAAIQSAKSYIYIENSYFSDNTILYELIKARRRGVDVRVILPVNGNHEIMNKSNTVTANVMFRNGIRVFFYPGMSHVKAAIYDGWMCAGTANFDKLSLKDNLELNIATSETEIVNRLKDKLFEKDFKRSLEMAEPIKQGLKEHIAEFLADQL